MRDPNKLQVNVFALAVSGSQDLRVGDLQRGRIYNILALSTELTPVISGLWPLNCIVQNLGTQNVYLAFERRSTVETIASSIIVPPNFQWTPFGIFPISNNVVVAAGSSIDVTDRVGRLLGVVASITSAVDVSDRAARLLGHTVTDTGSVTDMQDRAARLLGVVASITAAVDTSDRVGRLLGIVASITSAVDISDRAARLLGIVRDQQGADLNVNATAAVNTALTITLPAVAGQFHYITSIEWWKLYSVIGVAAGAGVIITSTNLPGGPAWTTEQLASAAGTVVKVMDYKPTKPLKSAVVNTATTIVAPLQLQTIWRGNVSYFTAA